MVGMTGTLTTEMDGSHCWETDENVMGRYTSNGTMDEEVKVWSAARKGICCVYAANREMKAALKWCLMVGRLCSCKARTVLVDV